MAVSTQWRVYITANNGSSQYVGTTELEMTDTPGGASKCVGGSPIASSNHLSYPPADAFNGNKSDRGWVCEANQFNPSYIGYNFPSEIQIKEFRLYGTNTGWFAPGFDPKTFELQYFNGVSWTTVSSYSNETGWVSFEERVYEGDLSSPEVATKVTGKCVRGVSNLPAHREIYAYSMTDGTYIGFTETDSYGDFEIDLTGTTPVFLRIVDPDGIYSTEIRENIIPITVPEE